MSERSLRICAVGNARSAYMQIYTRPFAALGHAVAILSPVPASPAGLEVLAPSAGHSTALRRARSYVEMVVLLHRWQPDVVIAHFAALPFTWLLPLVWFRPLFVAVLGADILFHQRPGLSPARRAATIRVLESADCVISRSAYMVAAQPSLHATTMVTPWGVDLGLFDEQAGVHNGRLDRAALGLPANAPIVLSPRRIVPICGVAGIVAAMPQVRQQIPEARLLLVDDEPDPSYREGVVDLIARLGIGDAVTWIRAVDHGDMPALYRLADVTVSVAHSDGVSTAVLESMAARTPVVLGNIPNYEDVFEDGRHCLLADPSDPASIAVAIVRLLTDGHLRDSVVEAAHAKTSREADIRRETARIVERMHQAVSSPRPWRLRRRIGHALKMAWVAFESDDARS